MEFSFQTQRRQSPRGKGKQRSEPAVVDRAEWTWPLKEMLLRCCHSKVIRVGLVKGNLSGRSWKAVKAYFHEKMGLVHEVSQLKNEFLKLKNEYAFIVQLLWHQTGAGLHPITGALDQELDWWLAKDVDCIGAIDGTHVKCVPPRNNKAAYYCRKGYTSQNVIAICDFNLCFMFASPGWEGCTYDSRVLRECREKYGGFFPHPANGKYYLVDQGYPHIEGYMAPYRGNDFRYHFQEFDNAPSRRVRKPKNPQEAFNYLHSSCRNVIERTFGVWKARFAILHSMPSYKMQKQVKIVMATMAIYNFLRINQSNDAAFNAAWENNYAPSDTEENKDEVDACPSTSRSARRSTWQLRRDEILNEIISQGYKLLITPVRL